VPALLTLVRPASNFRSLELMENVLQVDESRLFMTSSGLERAHNSKTRPTRPATGRSGVEYAGIVTQSPRGRARRIKSSRNQSDFIGDRSE
jgi:hypothetical protein